MNIQKKIYKDFTSEKASISVDFLFSFLIVMGLTYLILTLAFTLSFIEITQYITFSTARSYYASHKTQQEQRQQAENKYTALTTNPVWQHFFTKIAWFKIDSADDVIVSGDQNSKYSSQSKGQVEMFTGASTSFTSKLLAFNLPLIGSTTDEDSEKGFKTQISSFLGRAPSLEECQKFNKERSQKLKAKCGAKCETITPIADNGC